MRRVIGLDFGSSQSMVAVMEIGSTQYPEILKIDGNNEVSRTLLALDNNDDYRVAAGNEVWEMMKERGSKDFYVACNFKRYLGETMPEEEGDKVAGVSADKLCESFLAHMAEKLCNYYNVQRLSEADFSTCIAHPATWNEGQVQTLVNIVRKVGFPDVQAIAEPLAAVYAAMNKQDKQFADKAEHYLVVDFGGGTLDVCIVEMGILGRFAKIVSRSGNPRLGGREFDKIIETQYKRNANLNFSALSAREKTYIREECEEMKKLISENMAGGATRFTCIFNTPSQSKLPVTNDDIINWSKDAGIWNQYRECIEAALRKSGLDISQISKVVLTGGTSLWWFLKNVLTSEEEGYGLDEDKIILTDAPHTDVCIGCAIHAGYTENRQLIPGIWIKYRVGHHKNADEGWTEFQQIKAPALPGKQASCELKYLTHLPKSKLISSYRIEFKWFSGISESDLQAVDEELGVVEVYARSNQGVFGMVTSPARWIAKKVIEANGDKVEEVDDTYVLYIQMKETAAKLHYKLLMMDAKAKKRELVRLTMGEAEAAKLPKGKRIECEVEPGYISHWGVLGLGSPRLSKIK